MEKVLLRYWMLNHIEWCYELNGDNVKHIEGRGNTSTLGLSLHCQTNMTIIVQRAVRCAYEGTMCAAKATAAANIHNVSIAVDTNVNPLTQCFKDMLIWAIHFRNQ